MKTGEIRSSDGGKCEHHCLLGYDLVQSGGQAQTFRDMAVFVREISKLRGVKTK
jgi:hypothetical protein